MNGIEGFPVLVSAGGEERGREVAGRAARTIAWLDKAVGMPASTANPSRSIRPRCWRS